MRMGWFLGIEDPIVEKYIGFEEGGLRFGEASFMLVSTHSCSSPLVCSPPFVLLVCVFVCAHPHSFLLVFAHLFVLVPTTWSSQPLICVCLKYIVSKYIIAKQLTFIPWIINLDKSYWLVLIRRITYIIFWSEMGVGARGESGWQSHIWFCHVPHCEFTRNNDKIRKKTSF